MATKLYPPLIEGTIPAFCGTTIVVPFSLNRAVSTSEIAGFVLKLKTVQGSILLDSFIQVDSENWDLENDMTVSFDISSISSKLQVGQYYKLQLAFLSRNGSSLQTGYFSTVGVIKYTAMPSVTIDGLKRVGFNTHKYSYTMLYSQYEKDTTEKLYSTRFILKNASGEIIADSGEILHNTTNDSASYEASETYVISQDLVFGESYYLQAFVTTANNMLNKYGSTLSTPRYKLTQGSSIATNLNGYITAINNFDDGFVQVDLVGYLNEDGNESTCNGSFILSKAADNEDYVWHDVCSFSIVDSKTSRELWKDFTVEQGVTYKYSLQEVNNYGIRSDRVVSEPVTADFEDAFLYDGERQLKIRYNPKVSSFKTDLQEAKSETIGSQFPFIFRNGNIYYKEFPISGLISYKMDENEWFISKSDIKLEDETFDLLTNNIYAERNFKMSVMQWLTNGKVKLFRSPGEGNFIVRLMNISFSPSDQLGRMLHTFTSTAYEISKFSYDALVANNFVSTDDLNFSTMQWVTIEMASQNSGLDTLLASVRNYVDARVPIIFTQEQYSRVCNALPEFKDTKYFTAYGSGSYSLTNTLLEEDITKLESLIGTVTYVTGKINSYPVYHIDVRDMLPGTLIGIKQTFSSEMDYIQIGATGAYKASFESPIVGVYLITDQTNSNVSTAGVQGSITYGYKTNVATTFDLINQFETEDVPCRQWIGQPSKKIYNITSSEITSSITHNLIQVIEDSKTNISKIYSMRFTARPLREIFVKDKNSEGMLDTTFRIASSKQAYWDMNCTEGNEVDFNSLDPYYVYAVCHARFDYTYESVPYEGYYIYANYNHGYYVDKHGEKSDVFAGYYVDGKSTYNNIITYSEDEYHNTVTIGDDTIDLTEIEHFELNHFDDVIDVITFDNGVIGELSYQTAIKIFSFETSNVQASSLKLKYQAAVTKLEKYREYMSLTEPTSIQQTSYAYALNLTSMPTTEAELVQLEQTIVDEIHTTYNDFIYLVQTTLYAYEKENES